MLQTRRQAVRLLQRPRLHQLRGYADSRLPDGIDPNAGNDPSDPHDSIGKPSEHAASAGHVESTQRGDHPAPENEHMGKGFYITLAILFGSLAFYKSNRTDSASGEISQQPLFTRLLHYFDYLGEQNTIRNDLFTNMIQQAGNDKALFATTSRTGLGHVAAADTFFNTGAPWNVPAGHSANLDHLREHYRKQNIELEEQRVERVERIARRAAAVGKLDTERIKESLGFTAKKVSEVGSKASKGE